MVKHIILWKLKDSYSDAEKAEIKAGIKAGLEGLVGQVPGVVELKIHTNGLPSSNMDVMMECTLTDPQALASYAVHPAHVAVADTKVRPFTQLRSCLDFEV